MDSLLIERDGGIARLTLNRPQAGNAIDLQLARALFEAAIELDEDPSVRCVVLTGAGRLFCAGGDVVSFAASGDGLPALLKQLTGNIHSAISRFTRMSKPLLTVVNGPAAGAGYSLALMGDIVLAARSAHFTLAYSALGLTPDGGATWLLPRLVGMRAAQEIAITNRRVKAEEALSLGMVTRVVDDDALAAEAEATAQQLAAVASRATGRTRNLLLASFSNSLETQMELEARAISELSRDAEGREGVAAFIAKRKPNFDLPG